MLRNISVSLSISFQKIGENYVKRYKFELLKRSSDIQDIAAWLVVWAVPVGILVQMLRNGGSLDPEHESFVHVFTAGECCSFFIPVRGRSAIFFFFCAAVLCFRFGAVRNGGCL